MAERDQVAFELMHVDITLQVAAEQLVIQLVADEPRLVDDGVQASKKVTALSLQAIDRINALVGPLVIESTIAERRRESREVHHLTFPELS